MLRVSSSQGRVQYLKTYLFSLSFSAHNNTLFYDCVKRPSSSMCCLRRFKIVLFTLHYWHCQASPERVELTTEWHTHCQLHVKFSKTAKTHYVTAACIHLIVYPPQCYSLLMCFMLCYVRHYKYRHTAQCTFICLCLLWRVVRLLAFVSFLFDNYEIPLNKQLSTKIFRTHIGLSNRTNFADFLTSRARYVPNVAKRSMTTMQYWGPTTHRRRILEIFKRPYLGNGSSDPLHVWF